MGGERRCGGCVVMEDAAPPGMTHLEGLGEDDREDTSSFQEETAEEREVREEMEEVRGKERTERGEERTDRLPPDREPARASWNGVGVRVDDEWYDIVWVKFRRVATWYVRRCLSFESW